MAATLTRTKRVENLTPKEYRACYNLNLRDGGLMRAQLVAARHYREKNHQYYATMRFDREGSLVGWALTFTSNYGNYFDAYFYVRKNQRRNGVGKRLVSHVSRKFGQVRVYPHDYVSDTFFDYVHKNKLNVDIQ